MESQELWNPQLNALIIMSFSIVCAILLMNKEDVNNGKFLIIHVQPMEIRQNKLQLKLHVIMENMEKRLISSMMINQMFRIFQIITGLKYNVKLHRSLLGALFHYLKDHHLGVVIYYRMVTVMQLIEMMVRPKSK